MQSLSYRKPSPAGDMASIAEDSHGHLEVTREQHIRTIRKANRRSSQEGLDFNTDGKQRNSRNIASRIRAHSNDTLPNNLKSRISNLSKLIRVKGNLTPTSKHDQEQQFRLPMEDNESTPPVNRQRSRLTDQPSPNSSQFLGDNGSVNSSVAVESVANLTEASLDTVKVSNISEKTSGSCGSFHSRLKGKSVLKHWNKFKRLVGVKTAPEDANGNCNDPSIYNHKYNVHRDRANTDDTKSSNTQSSSSPWRRARSECSSSAASSYVTGRSNPPIESYNMDSKAKGMMDDKIRGRLDGVEMLSLGTSHLIDNSPLSTKQRGSINDDDILLPTLTYTFSGQSLKSTNSELVNQMLSSSGGSYPPEIILEGICPGPDGRWTVRLEEQYLLKALPDSKISGSEKVRAESTSSSNIAKNRASSEGQSSWQADWSSPFITCPQPDNLDPPGLQQLSSSSEDFDASADSSTVPVHILQKKLWGPDIGPADLKNLDDDEEEAPSKKKRFQFAHQRDDSFSNSSYNAEDPLLSLAAKCSIPIDVDEDMFIISSRDHVNSIHEIASASIAKGRISVALRVFQTLLKGLNALKYSDSSNQTDKEESDLRFAKGATMHNIGILQMWLGQFQGAMKSFENAVTERQRLLPKHHSDICVSMIRQATASFAIGQMEDSKMILEQVLTMLPLGHVARAKILNNLAVVYFRQGNSNEALKEFTKSLEIQRVWLDSPVRRPCTVYDAALTLCNMGELYLDRNDSELAIYLYEEALLFQTSIFPKDHPSVLLTLSSLAIAKVRNGDLDNAIHILQGCLRGQTTKYGKNSSHAVNTIGLLGILYARIHSYEESLQCFVQVRKWQKLNLLVPTPHPALRESKDLIKVVENAVYSRGKNSSRLTGINNNITSSPHASTTPTSISNGGNQTGSTPKVWV